MNTNVKIELNKMKQMLMALTDGRVSILFQLPLQEYLHLKETTQSLQDKSVNQLLTRVLPVPLSRKDNVLVLCKKLSKFHKPPLKSFEIFHQVYISLPLSGNVNKRKYRKPSKTVK